MGVWNWKVKWCNDEWCGTLLSAWLIPSQLLSHFGLGVKTPLHIQLLLPGLLPEDCELVFKSFLQEAMTTLKRDQGWNGWSRKHGKRDSPKHKDILHYSLYWNESVKTSKNWSLSHPTSSKCLIICGRSLGFFHCSCNHSGQLSFWLGLYSQTRRKRASRAASVNGTCT